MCIPVTIEESVGKQECEGARNMISQPNNDCRQVPNTCQPNTRPWAHPVALAGDWRTVYLIALLKAESIRQETAMCVSLSLSVMVCGAQEA